MTRFPTLLLETLGSLPSQPWGRDLRVSLYKDLHMDAEILLLAIFCLGTVWYLWGFIA